MFRRTLLACVVALIALPCALLADGEKKDGEGAQKMQPPPVPPEMKDLASWVGEWTFELEEMPGPMGPGGKGTGTWTVREGLKGMAYIGEYACKSGSMGEFEGHAVYSYDAAAKKWHIFWFDSWMPGHVSDSVGEYKDGSLVVESTEGEEGRQHTMRITEKWVTRDQVDWKMEGKQGDNWGVMMSATYTRKK